MLKIINIDIEDYLTKKKNGIYVIYSSSCNTCSDHMNKLSKHFSFYSIDYDSDIDYFESIKVIPPTTILYKNNEIAWSIIGMMFDKQISELGKLL